LLASRRHGCRLYDVHWTPAVLMEKPSGKKGEAWRVGLPDGRVLPLAIDNAVVKRKLMLYDVVLVRVAVGKGKADTRAELRVRPCSTPSSIGRLTDRSLRASAHLVLNFKDLAPPSPRGALANATPRRFPFRLITRNLSSGTEARRV
jgi:hypothetical protein